MAINGESVDGFSHGQCCNKSLQISVAFVTVDMFIIYYTGSMFMALCYHCRFYELAFRDFLRHLNYIHFIANWLAARILLTGGRSHGTHGRMKTGSRRWSWAGSRGDAREFRRIKLMLVYLSIYDNRLSLNYRYLKQFLAFWKFWIKTYGLHSQLLWWNYLGQNCSS